MPLAHGRVAARDAAALPHHVLVLLAAVAAAVVAQGGYYLPGRVLSAVLVGVALLLALRTRPPVGLLPWTCGALAAWAVLRALPDNGFTSSLPTVLALATLAATAVVAGRADPAQRGLAASALVAVGALVGLTGWAAVVFRVPSWSVVAEGLTRAAATLTYPNAAAALLAALAVLALALHTADPGSLPLAGASCLMLVGLGATLSRAGLLALAAGVVALCASTGPRAVLRHLAPAVLGALIALGALAPSVPSAGTSSPVLAALGLVVGLAVALGLTRAARAIRLVGLAAGFAVAAVGALVIHRDRLADLFGSRATTSSPDRAGAIRSAFEQVAGHPWTGCGPGRGWFAFTSPAGEVRVMRYVHDEYLQVLVELGVIGLVLLLAVLVAGGLAVWRGRRGTPLWAGAAAGLVVLLVHSGFDFLWHLPVTLLVAGLLVGLASSPPSGGDAPSSVQQKEKS
ncbi:O-antigen ligase family protein [Saccharothrix sp. MB29]|nr:O-antigen ligase family protein [Saccharothrix sp. MB29]